MRGEERFSDPLVNAARAELAKIWAELGNPSPVVRTPELEAARRVYHAVLAAYELKMEARGKVRLTLVE